MFTTNCTEYLNATELLLLQAGGSNGNGSALSDGSEFTSSYLWIVGMIFAIVSSLAVAFGTVLQKRAFVREAALEEHARHRKRWGFLLSATWLWGLLFMILQIPLTVAALALAPQSLVNPLGAGCTIVLSLVLAVFLLGEKMGRMEVAGSMLIIVGVILTTAGSAMGSNGKRKLTACDMVSRFGASEFQAMFIVLLGLIVVGMFVVRHHDRVPSANLLTIVIAFTAGGMGAVLNVFLKLLGEYMSGAIAGEPSAQAVWSTVHPYYSLLVVIVMALGMISYISQGLEHSVAVLFLPVYNCLFIVLSSVLGGLFYQEFDSLDQQGGGGIVLFPLGICVIVTGIFGSVMGSANLSPRDRLRMLKRELIGDRGGGGGGIGGGIEDPHPHHGKMVVPVEAATTDEATHQQQQPPHA